MFKKDKEKLNMKRNRSNRYTKGLVCTYANSPLRSFFFELDSEHKELYQDIKKNCKIRKIFQSDGIRKIFHKTSLIWKIDKLYAPIYGRNFFQTF